MANIDKIIEQMKEKFDIKEFSLDSSLTDLQIDSLDIVEFLLGLEEEYNVEFTPEEMNGIKSAGDLINLIKEKIK